MFQHRNSKFSLSELLEESAINTHFEAHSPQTQIADQIIEALWPGSENHALELDDANKAMAYPFALQKPLNRDRNLRWNSSPDSPVNNEANEEWNDHHGHLSKQS